LCLAIVKRKHGKNIPRVIITAPANAVPNPPSLRPPWNPTKVANITKGARKMLPIAIQSMNTLCGSYLPLSTALTCTNSITVYTPLNERLPVTRPSTKRLIKEGVSEMPRARATKKGNP
jgi:hypothetical protein